MSKTTYRRADDFLFVMPFTPAEAEAFISAVGQAADVGIRPSGPQIIYSEPTLVFPPGAAADEAQRIAPTFT